MCFRDYNGANFKENVIKTGNIGQKHIQITFETWIHYNTNF